MCGQCRSASTGVDWYTAGVADSLAARRRARSALGEAASTLLAGLGLRVVAHPGALTLNVRTSTGRSVTVSGLDEIIEAATELTGRTVDPLDPAVIDAAGRRNGNGS